MSKLRFHTALVTPMRADDSLHVEALEVLAEQQIRAGITGFLAGGTMGAMQLLRHETYRSLVRACVRIASGRVEMLAGAGDASLGLTVERIEFLNGLALDGVVVLPPYLMAFNQTELIDYYRHLADASRAPVFLYDLPILTRCKIAVDTVLALAKHPNIAGIKCSDEPGFARQVRDEAPEGFRVIPAAATLMDALIASGFDEHLDGVYCLCPAQITALGEAAATGRRDEAAGLQQGLNRTLRGLQKHEVWRPFTALMHEIGIEGRFKPRPHRDWDANETRAYLESVEGRDALAFMQSTKCELTPQGR